MPYKDPAKQRKFQKKWIKKRRTDYFKGKKCSICGKPISASTAELDHKKAIGNKGKNKDDHKVYSLSKENRNKRVAKHGMRPVCKACHKKKTKKDIKKMNEDFPITAILPSSIDDLVYSFLKDKIKKNKD